ncbi:MAG: hypothetical protein D6794_10020 [Deltaproteobacteria bacterium]|nr:MAG: hypothetical protein D6794_10020 [Deltaproteobacteria bacterium]
MYAATTGTTNALVHPAVQVGEASGGKTALPGGVVTYTVVITNSGDYTDTFDLALSGASWPIQVSATSVGPLKAGASASVVVSVTIPTQPAALGDDFVLSAVSRLDARVKISLKRTTTADITPGVALAPVVAGATGYAGKAVTHTLTLTNTGTWTDTFGITLSGNVWQADVPLTLTLAAGAAAPLRVVVHIPANAADGAGDMLSVQVHSGYSSMVTASSQLTTTARNVRRLYLPVILR